MRQIDRGLTEGTDMRPMNKTPFIHSQSLPSLLPVAEVLDRQIQPKAD